MNKLTQACILSNEAWIESFPDNIEEFEHSAAYERQIKRLFSKMRGDKYHRLTKNAVRIIVIAAVIASLTITAFAVPAGRDYMIKKFSDHSVYTIADVGKAKDVTDLTVGYIPEGFELIHEEETYKVFFYEYGNNYGDVYSVYKLKCNFDYSFNSEVYSFDIWKNASIEYVICKSDENHINITWNNTEYLFAVTGSLDEDELKKIAISVK